MPTLNSTLELVKLFQIQEGKGSSGSRRQLRGEFPTYDEARSFASKKKVALVFVVDEPPSEREIKIFGAEMKCGTS